MKGGGETKQPNGELEGGGGEAIGLDKGGRCRSPHHKDEKEE